MDETFAQCLEFEMYRTFQWKVYAHPAFEDFVHCYCAGDPLDRDYWK